MKKKHLYLLAAGVGAYLLYKRSKHAAVASAPVVKDTQTVAGALGAVMTGNPMLQALGSLGTNGYKLRHW